MVRFYQFYQTQDANIIDYELYPFDDIELRGPKTNHPNYIAYIGAAQTFGRYCKKPFPSIIGERLNIGTLNFGFGGMGPTYFLNNTAIMDTVNKAELVVVQVLSARSISNSIFQSTIGSSFGINMKDGRKMHSDKIFQELFNGKDKRGLDEKFMRELIEETRQNYVSAMIDLLKAIQSPKVLFWFSVRKPQQCGEIYYRNSWLKKNIYRFDVIEKVAQSNKFIKRVLNRFIIYGLGRCGSTLLGNLLNSVSQIHCDREILHDPVRSPRLHIEKCASRCELPVYGFKLLQYQIREVQSIKQPEKFLLNLHEVGFKFIYLSRRNLLRHGFSNVYARQKQFHLRVGEMVDGGLS